MQTKSNHQCSRKVVSVAAAVAVASLLAGTSHAATVYWDGDGSAGGFTGTGTWNTANANWNSAADFSGVWTGWTTGDIASFGSTGGIVTLAPTLPSAGGLIFTSSGYSITAQTLTLANAAGVNIEVEGAATAQIGSIVAQAGNTVNKTGTGKLVFDGATVNTSAANSVFNLNSGEVESARTGTGSSIAALIFNIGDGVGAAGSAIFSQTGSSTNHINNNTVVNLNSDGIWTRNAGVTDTIAYIGKLSGQNIGGGALGLSVTGNTNVSGSNSISADLNIASGGIRNRTWTFANATDTLELSGAISGANASFMTFTGPVGSKVSYSGNDANTYVGATTVTGTTLELAKGGSGNALASGLTALTINSGGTVKLVGRGEQINDSFNTAPYLVLGGVGAAANGTFDLNGFTETLDRLPFNMNGGAVVKSSVPGGLYIARSSTNGGNSGGQITVTGTGNLISVDTQLSNADSRGAGTIDPYRRVLVTGALDTLEITGKISNYASTIGDTSHFSLLQLDKRGLGKLTLRADSTFYGQTAVNVGTLSIDRDRSLGSVPTSATPNSLIISGSTLNALESFTLHANRGVGLSATATLSLDAGKTLTIAGVVANSSSATGGITATGSGELALNNAANAYSGATRISTGTTVSVSSLTDGNGVSRIGDYGTDDLITNIDTTGLSVGMVVGGSGKLSAGTTILEIVDSTTVRVSSNSGSAGAGIATVFGTPNSLGISPFATAASLVLDGGALKYTGSTAGTTNRNYQLLTTGGGFNASGSSDAATMTITGTMTATGSSGSQSLTLGGTNTGANTFSGSITNGSGTNVTNLAKTGSGRWVISGAKAFTGFTVISGGTLELDATGSVNTSSGITVGAEDARLITNSGTPITIPVTLTQGTIGGTGAIGTPVTVGTGGELSPGNSPGSQSYTAGLTWAGGGSYLWEVNDTTGTAGTNLGWDLLNISGGSGLVITATSGSKFTIDVSSLAGLVAGDAANWVDADQSWIIASADSISGFDADAFQVVTSGFSNDFSGDFSVALSGNNISLVYTAVPEPAGLALAGFAVAALVSRRRRASL